MKGPFTSIVLALAALLAAGHGTAIAQSIIGAPDDRISISTEPTLNAGVSDIEVHCAKTGAMLYIDKIYVGRVPYSGDLVPGSHYIEVSQPGYYALGTWLMLREKTKYTLDFKLARITGDIVIEVLPADASIDVDGASVSPGLVQLPVGTHTLTIKRFGFAEQTRVVTIEANVVGRLSVSLEKTAFTITGLEFSRKTFNPRNSGAPGKTSLEFRASSYGSANAEIRSQDGELVATLAYPAITTWSQSRTWEGLATDGTPLPDGVYSAQLIAKPEPASPTQPEGTILARAEVRIDSSLVIRSFGTVSASPGLLYMPDASPQPGGTTAVETSWFSPRGGPQASAIGLSAAVSIGGIASLAIHAAAETGDAESAADIAGSALVSLFGEKAGPLSGAIFIRGSYSSASSPVLPGARRAVEMSLPLATRLGEFSFSLSPGALVDLASSSAAFLGVARAGLMLEGQSFRMGLSGELPLSFAGAVLAPQWPAHAALEGRLMLGSTPLVAAAYLDAEIERERAAVLGINPARLEVGLGLGLLF
jgi:hypothetical protein